MLLQIGPLTEASKIGSSVISSLLSPLACSGTLAARRAEKRRDDKCSRLDGVR